MGLALLLLSFNSLFAQDTSASINNLQCNRSVGGYNNQFNFINFQFDVNVLSSQLDTVIIKLDSPTGQSILNIGGVIEHSNGNYYLNLGNHGNTVINSNTLNGSLLIPTVNINQSITVTVYYIDKNKNHSTNSTCTSSTN